VKGLRIFITFASSFAPFAVPVKIHLYEEYVRAEIAQAEAKETQNIRKPTTDRKFF